ncbi:MAG TPA: T9SS type A sorting domain-containing protein [Bacteroidales bacterium]|nr:T9SS type A sorting domain-containing protein [Bacteroidales bacterium]
MIRHKIILSLIIVAGGIFVSAQEVVTGLQSNYAILRESENKSKGTGKSSADTIELPFFDDFSGKSIFPDFEKWSDNFVFINDKYSDRQITKGIATFDAIDANGRLYETAISTGFAGDILTSLPINLEYSASDNILLSFYYEAGGLGDAPEPDDSLTLQFLDSSENKWYSVWQARGRTEKGFRQTAIRIDDQRFLKKGFRFRFINYVTISQNSNDDGMIGNCDHWNIDYIYLDKNRELTDTAYADVAFRTSVRSLLKTHESMPWNQFREIELQEMGSIIPIYYRNNDVIVRNVTRNFQIWDVNLNTQVHSFTAGATNIEPQTNIDYKASLIYTFKSSDPDSAIFKIICSLKTDDFDPKGNDTVVYYQVFKNYFAFDDGTAEMGYGINGLGSRNAMVACRFTSYIPDTLRSVQICFNDSYRDANKRAFDLIVWDDDNGVPGNILYRGEELMVEQSSRINGFYTYEVAEGVPVKGIFYVGWKQRSETFLNAGLDVNTPQNGKQFYWLNGDWVQSQVYGSIMIRPVVGALPKTTSIDDIYRKQQIQVLISPNPARDFITVSTSDINNYDLTWITITDLNGRELLKCRNNGPINISSLNQGIYIIFISSSGRPVGYSRLIKVR